MLTSADRKDQGPVVRYVDSTIHGINLYPEDNAISFPNTYPADRDLSVGQRYPMFEQPGPAVFVLIQYYSVVLILNYF